MTAFAFILQSDFTRYYTASYQYKKQFKLIGTVIGYCKLSNVKYSRHEK
ncbi:hypothetical protein [Flavobacterium palustre]|nr:hypothetical protein [Flavobacterium palustre]